MAKNTVSAEQFVAIYLAAETMEEVIEKTQLNKASIQSRCSHLRKLGVNLPKKFKGTFGGKKLDIASLNALIEASLNPPSVGAVLTAPAPLPTTTKGQKGKKK